MYTDTAILECTKHLLGFEYPRNWDELHLPAPRCSVCSAEEAEKWQSRFTAMKDQRDKIIGVIDIKNNTEVDSI